MQKLKIGSKFCFIAYGTDDFVGDMTPIPALEILDTLDDVFEQDKLNLPALISRYKDYLNRLKEKGLNTWKCQPRRKDMHLTEAVGHFHLYSWLQSALGHTCIISPEFPTGNGKVDLHLRYNRHEGIIEVKSFVHTSELKNARIKAADYAKNLNIDSVLIAVFVPTDDEKVLEKLSGEEVINHITVTVCAIEWQGRVRHR